MKNKERSTKKRKMIYKLTWEQRNVAKGLCIRCNNKLFTKTFCKKHRDNHNKNARAMWKKKHEANIRKTKAMAEKTS